MIPTEVVTCVSRLERLLDAVSGKWLTIRTSWAANSFDHTPENRAGDEMATNVTPSPADLRNSRVVG